MSEPSSRNITPETDFKDKLIKVIPGEVVAAYMAIDGIIPPPSQSRHTLTMLLVSAIVLLALIPFYLKKFQGVTNNKQIVFTMGTFLVWLYSLGGPFKYR
jgi:hypothetical protein